MPILSLASRQGRAGGQLPLPGLGSCFLPAHTLRCEQRWPSPFSSTLLLQFGQIHLYINFTSHLQKEPCEGLHAPHPCVPYEDGGAGHRESGTPGERGPGRAQPWPLPEALPNTGSNPPLPPAPCQIFCCLHLCFCASESPKPLSKQCVGERSPHVISG